MCCGTYSRSPHTSRDHLSGNVVVQLRLESLRPDHQSSKCTDMPFCLVFLVALFGSETVNGWKEGANTEAIQSCWKALLAGRTTKADVVEKAMV
eukprot:1738085-Amphidinium_carterae.1